MSKLQGAKEPFACACQRNVSLQCLSGGLSRLVPSPHLFGRSQILTATPSVQDWEARYESLAGNSANGYCGHAMNERKLVHPLAVS